MTDSSDFSHLFNLDSEFDDLAKDFDLSGEPNFDLLGVNVDLFGESFDEQPLEMPNPVPEVPASLASAVSTGSQSNVEPSTVSLQTVEPLQTSSSPRSAPTSPTKQVSSPQPTPQVVEPLPTVSLRICAPTSPIKEAPSPQPPQSRLPPGRGFASVPLHTLVRRCSPPPYSTLPPSSVRPQARSHPSPSGFPQRIPIVSPGSPLVRYANIGPPPSGPLNAPRYTPVALMTASPSGEVAPTLCKKRKAAESEDTLTNLCSSVGDVESQAASDAAGENMPAKRRRLEHWTVRQVRDLELKGKENEALAHAKEYRRLRNTALEQAEEYKRLGTNAILRCNLYRDKRRQLRGEV